ncbi:ABC transporter permease [Natronocalculus amylovorans]|uniref:ABC transporter permease n=1 Tax=Natronocalculus amylovorans TaxID=2917812 RepID=A0AAE3FWW2_9EURY|nr:ABC transporter permease [Natronocalculus amylovorans]MCL9816736.1 ABC transporter permease [Natronocalculus amylovorans]NUE01183.1 ABC transporter permease [Halorubraceae archaeon YAN]
MSAIDRLAARTPLPVGFYTLTKREILRYVRRPKNTFAPPLITNILYFSVFGVVLGARVGEIIGVPYILFILPGLIVLGAISNAFENASFSIFHGRWNEYIHETLTSPLSYTQMVWAYIISAAFRGLLVGVIIAAVGVAIISSLYQPVPVENPFYLMAFMIVIVLLFASLGVVGGLLATDFDDLTMMNQFILRPLVFFGAVFYSLNDLTPLLRDISLLNPMVYMVNGVRYGFLGVAEVDPNLSLAVLAGATVVVASIDVWLFKRGYGLTD